MVTTLGDKEAKTIRMAVQSLSEIAKRKEASPALQREIKKVIDRLESVTQFGDAPRDVIAQSMCVQASGEAVTAENIQSWYEIADIILRALEAAGYSVEKEGEGV